MPRQLAVASFLVQLLSRDQPPKHLAVYQFLSLNQRRRSFRYDAPYPILLVKLHSTDRMALL